MRVENIPTTPNVVRIYYRNNNIASYISAMLFLKFYEQKDSIITKCYLNKVNGINLSDDQVIKLNASATTNDLNIFVDVKCPEKIFSTFIGKTCLLINSLYKNNTYVVENEFSTTVDMQLLESLGFNCQKYFSIEHLEKYLDITVLKRLSSVYISFKCLLYLHMQKYSKDISIKKVDTEIEKYGLPKLIAMYVMQNDADIRIFENQVIKTVLEPIPSHLSINFTKNNVFSSLFTHIFTNKQCADKAYDNVLYLSQQFKIRDISKNKMLAHKTVSAIQNCFNIEGLTALVANIPEVPISFFNPYLEDAEDTDKYKIGVTYYKTATNWKITLYAFKEKVDILAIANMYKFNCGNKFSCSFFVNDITKLFPIEFFTGCDTETDDIVMID